MLEVTIVFICQKDSMSTLDGRKCIENYDIDVFSSLKKYEKEISSKSSLSLFELLPHFLFAELHARSPICFTSH